MAISVVEQFQAETSGGGNCRPSMILWALCQHSHTDSRDDFTDSLSLTQGGCTTSEPDTAYNILIFVNYTHLLEVPTLLIIPLRIKGENAFTSCTISHT